MLLFRYQPINKFTLENLIHEQNWASNPINFNDPFEFSLRSGDTINEDNKYISISNEDSLIRKEIQKTLNNMGVVSYSESYDNILLWSHYANNHKGMCLVFVVENPKDARLYKVNYEDNIFRTGFSNDSINKPLLYTKSKAWSYEKEHRQLFMYSERHFDYPSDLIEIIFGCQCPIGDITTVVKICDSKNVTFSKMHIQQDTFNLSKSSVSNIDYKSIPNFWHGKFNEDISKK